MHTTEKNADFRDYFDQTNRQTETASEGQCTSVCEATTTEAGAVTPGLNEWIR